MTTGSTDPNPGMEFPVGGATPAAGPQDPNQTQQAQPEGEPPQQPQQPQLPPELQAAIQAQIQTALDQNNAQHEERIRQLELEKARLEGQLSMGAPNQTPQPQFQTEREYELAIGALELEKRNALENEDQQRAQQAQNQIQMVRNDHGLFMQTQQREQEEARNRELERTRFLAANQIDPTSPIARDVQVLHDGGVTLNEIQQRIHLPTQAPAAPATTTQPGAPVQPGNTQIETGQERTGPPPPISVPAQKTPQQEQDDQLTEHYRRHTGGNAAERALGLVS